MPRPARVRRLPEPLNSKPFAARAPDAALMSTWTDVERRSHVPRHRECSSKPPRAMYLGHPASRIAELR